ncbi:MAG TPA: hypothetical protein VNW46_02110, partial [Gemmatimonadaceae bacterium]|nr:hypothetical protein [Gemmatimonadaceae bacterium]
VGTVIDNTEIQGLSSLNRQFTDFVVLTPEVSSTNELGGFSAAGENPHYNSIQIDGATEADLFGLGSTGQAGGQAGGKSISIESIKEFQVLISPYDVRDGEFAGALINAVTKSGTNQFHGSAYEYYRNQAIGRSQPYLPQYNESQFGFSLGGPIIKDKILFFVNPEFQTESSPAAGPVFSTVSPALQGDITRFAQLASSYGLPTGSAGAVTNRHPLSNVFARLDVNLPFGTTLVLRNNYAHADEDVFGRSLTSFPLTSNAHTFESMKNATVAELRTNFANGAFNELIFNYELIRDNRYGASHSPQITVFDNTVSLITGTETASQGNSLNQDLIEVRENFTYPIGNHAITIGTQDQFYKVRNLFAQFAYSAWQFEGLDSLQAGIPHFYRIGIPAPGGRGGAVNFHTDNIGFYLQDQWQATPRLNLTYGIRFDIPIWPDKPPFNASLDSADLGNINTSRLPTGQVQYSPRVGFTYDVTGDQRNNVHGGVGIFQGAPAYVWLSNSFQNSGLSGYQQLTCNNTGTGRPPAFTPGNIQNPPTACGGGLTAKAGAEIDYTDPKFKYPQDLKASLGYDPQLGGGFSGHLSALYTHAIYAPIFLNAALHAPIATGPFGNAVYGVSPNNPTIVGGHSEIIELTNTNKNYSYALTGGFSKKFSRWLEGDVYYTYSQARDVQSVTSSTSASSYIFSWTPAFDQRKQQLGRANFETPHKITADLYYEMPWHTKIGATYIGTSGQAYTFTYGIDANGDGISGNDPIYIPKNVTDPTQIQFAPAGGLTTAQEQALFQKFLDQNPCLAHQAGHFMARNSCRTPWQNTLNVSLQQSLEFLHIHSLTLRADVFNFLNLLDKNWGVVYEGEGAQTLLGQPAANPRTTGPLNTGGMPIVTFTNLNNPGKIFDPVASNWQMQFGARYAF